MAQAWASLCRMGTPAHRTPDAGRPIRTILAVELGGFRLALTRDADSARPAQARPFGLGAFAGLTLATLALAGASAAPRPDAPIRYVVSVDVPPPVAQVARPAPRPSLGRFVRKPPPVSAVEDTSFDAADAPYIARAMATGALQEWEGADGQLRFLTAGPPRTAGGRTCRDMALLIRLAEGGSRVRSAERCTTEPVSAAAQPAEPPEEHPVLQD